MERTLHPSLVLIMTPRQIDVVVETFALMLKLKPDAGMEFYRRLFAIAPETRVLFKSDLYVQSRKLMDMLGTAIGSLHKTASLKQALADLGVRHASYGVKPSHYFLVGDALISTLAAVLGSAFDDEMRIAWMTLYREVSLAMLVGKANSAKETFGSRHIALGA